jgi:hypothetical protein
MLDGEIRTATPVRPTRSIQDSAIFQHDPKPPADLEEGGGLSKKWRRGGE